jgi:hypothetical protein
MMLLEAGCDACVPVIFNFMDLLLSASSLEDQTSKLNIHTGILGISHILSKSETFI